MREQLVMLVTFMGMLGIPSIFTMTVFCIKKCNAYTKQFIMLMKAQKAQMRAQLLKDYEYYMQQGYIDDIHMKEWQNQYLCYHELVGENGILNDRYKKLLALPSSKEEQ